MDKPWWNFKAQQTAVKPCSRQQRKHAFGRMKGRKMAFCRAHVEIHVGDVQCEQEGHSFHGRARTHYHYGQHGTWTTCSTASKKWYKQPISCQTQRFPTSFVGHAPCTLVWISRTHGRIHSKLLCTKISSMKKRWLVDDLWHHFVAKRSNFV